MGTKKDQINRFKEAARESGADMSKEEFGRGIGGLAKPKPEKRPESGQGTKEAPCEDA